MSISKSSSFQQEVVTDARLTEIVSNKRSLITSASKEEGVSYSGNKKLMVTAYGTTGSNESFVVFKSTTYADGKKTVVDYVDEMIYYNNEEFLENGKKQAQSVDDALSSAGLI